MPKREKTLIALLAAFVVVSLLPVIWLQVRPLTIEQIRAQDGVRILRQEEVKLDLTVDLSQLPEDLELDNHDKDWYIPVYEDETTTIYLQKMDDGDGDTLRIWFCMEYKDSLPEEGSVLLDYRLVDRGTEGLYPYTETCLIDGVEVEGVMSVAGHGNGVIGFWIDNSAFEQARETVTFCGVSYNRLTYETID